MTASRDETLVEHAFELALFLHRSPADAAAVAAAALSKLRVAATAQGRRRAYLPRGRRTRVSTGEMHLLQRLIYIESEPFERRTEEAGDPDEAEMIVRYVKHLVRIAWKRSSFYAVLGVSRLLHRYGTPETMDLYSLVVQDPGRVRDDYYYRSCKKLLLEELAARFGERLEVVQGERGERRFRGLAEPGPFAELVAECLRRFTPWETVCPVPAVFDPLAAELPDLVFADGDPDREHPVEVRRFHAVLHPDCYRRLVSALGLPPPEKKLDVPLFRCPERGGRPGGTDRREAAPGAARRTVAALLAAEEKRRRLSRGRFLVVWIDGEERARLDRGSGRVAVDAGQGAEMVEVRGDGGAVLAVCLLGWAEGGKERSVVLGGGETVTFLVSPERPDGGVHIDIACHSARSLATATRAWLKRVARVPVPVRVASGAALLGLLLVMVVWHAGEMPSSRGTPGPPPARPATPPQPGETPGTPAAPAGPGPAARPAAPVEEDRVRGILTGPAAVPLSRVESIFVDPPGEGAFALELRAALVERLRAEGVFAVSEDRETADAVLTGSTDGSGRLVISLIDADGDVLWTDNAEGGLPADQAAAAVAAALRSAAGR